MRPACWRWRLRHRELFSSFGTHPPPSDTATAEVRFGRHRNQTRETGAPPRKFIVRALQPKALIIVSRLARRARANRRLLLGPRTRRDKKINLASLFMIDTPL